MTRRGFVSGLALGAGIRSRFVKGVNGLKVHYLEAGAGPCVLLLHGFPELAYSWRKVMPRLATAGYRVVAPDQRGYGRTTGWDPRYDGELGSFGMLNLVRDAVELVAALGVKSVSAVVGHDFGSPVAAWCALTRPDVFRSVVMMSAPFAGPPSGSANIDEQLAALERPRKHYTTYYSTREANENMWHCPQGVHAFLRAYYHFKSADWKGNQPFPLAAWNAAEVAKMPEYYVMDLAKGMAETVAPHLPPAPAGWLTEAELRVYSGEYARTGFQGGLQWYRAARDARQIATLSAFAGRKIDVPACFIAGKSDWGVYQRPGALEKMQREVCTEMRGVHLIEGTGHWVQQEQGPRVSELLLEFLRMER